MYNSFLILNFSFLILHFSFLIQKMSLVKKLAGETAIYGISSILSRVLHYVILTPYLTRYFGTGGYGVVSLLFTYAAVLMIVFTYRMETTFFRFGSEKGALDKTFSTASLSLIFTTVLLTVSLTFFLEPIANWLEYPDHPEYILWVILIIAIDALLAIPFARLRLENRPIKFALAKTLHILINIFLIFFFLEWVPVFAENGVTWAATVAQSYDGVSYVFIANLIASGLILLMLSPVYLKIKFHFDAILWKKMMWYAMPLVVVGFAGVVNQLGANLMLEQFFSDDVDKNRDVVGMYAAAAKLAVLMNLFTQAFNYAAEPFFFRNANRADSKVIYADVAQAFAMVGSLVFLGIMLYLDVIQYFLGKDFREGLEIVPLLLIANFFLGLYYNFSIWYKLTDKTRIGGYISIVGVLITIGLNALLIPIIQYPAPAITTMACYGFMAMASYYIGQKYYPIPYPMKRIMGYLGLAVTFYAGTVLLWEMVEMDSLVLRLVVHTVVLGAYVGVIYRMEKVTLKRLFG